MRTISICAAVASLFVMFAACGPKQPDASQQPAMAPTGTAYGYPQQPGAYPQPGGYPQPTATYQQPMGAPTGYATAPTAPTAAPTAPAAGQMVVPGPAAFQCSNDGVPCGLNHCNMQYGKCAFPCASAADCISPNTCGPLGFCLPAMQPPAAPSH
jgi:hypothetical protein